MIRRTLITLYRDEVAPRFDLATEVLIVTFRDSESGGGEERQILILGRIAADDLCDLILSKDVGIVVCGGIEDEYYHYLRWKRVEVLDSVIGSAERVIERLRTGELKSGDILLERRGASNV